MVKVLNALFDDRYGGPHKRVIDVAEKLLPKGVETIVMLPHGAGNAAEIAGAKQIKVVRVSIRKMPRPNEIFKLMAWIFLLARDVYRIAVQLKVNDIDLVHVNGAFFMAPAIAARLTGRKLVWHLNDTIVSRPVARLLGWMVKRMADRIVVAAHAVARHYFIKEGRYTVIYAPVDVDAIRAKSPAKLTVKSGDARTKRVCLVGNWNPVKGLEVFVAAAALIRDRYQGEVEFTMAGAQLLSHKPYAESVIRQIEKLRLTQSIHVTGFVDDMNAFLQRQDVLILSSWSEAAPMSVLEAMAAGIPVVATDVGGVREMLAPGSADAAGHVVPPGDSAAIADKLCDLLNDERGCQAMGSSGRAAAENRFSLDQCQVRHLAVYKEAMGDEADL